MLKEFFRKNKTPFRYLIFGALTTVINILVYNVCYYGIDFSNNISNVIAWVTSVLFAYVTNKLWVFEKREFLLSSLIQEITSFFFFRIATGVLDMIIMYISVDVLSCTAWKIKIISNIIVIILNYIASKYVVFKRKGTGKS